MDAESAKKDKGKVDITELFMEGVPEIVIGGERKAIKYFGRQPEEPHPKLMDKFEEAFEKWLEGSAGIPRIQVPPGWAAIGLALAIGIQMFVQGEKLEKLRPARAASPDPGARNTTEGSAPSAARATAASESQTPSPQSSPQPLRLYTVPEDGSATGAAPSSSAE